LELLIHEADKVSDDEGNSGTHDHEANGDKIVREIAGGAADSGYGVDCNVGNQDSGKAGMAADNQPANDAHDRGADDDGLNLG